MNCILIVRARPMINETNKQFVTHTKCICDARFKKKCYLTSLKHEQTNTFAKTLVKKRRVSYCKFVIDCDIHYY